jgi:pilus assembly protein CpaF
MAASTQPQTIFLGIETADGGMERLRIDEVGPVFIGRDQSCHVVLPSPEVSRRHVALKAEDGRIRLTDKSANGTYVGEHRKRVHNTTVIIGAGVPFQVGPYRLQVLPDHERDKARAGPASVPVVAADFAPGSPSDLTLAPSPAQAEQLRQARPAAERAAAAPQKPQKAEKSIVGSFLSRIPQLNARTQKSSAYSATGTEKVPVEARRRIHRLLLDHLDLATLDRNRMDDRLMRPKVREALTRIVRQIARDLPEGTDIGALVEEMTNEALGLGPLEALLADEAVSEIMVVDPNTIFIERSGKIELTDLRFTDDDAVRACIERIVTPLGRRIDESTPLVDARLKDGSRVNAVIPPLALRGPCITIRKFRREPLTIDDLIRFGAITEQMALFLTRAVVTRRNVVISGGTGSGKTTLLNVLSAAIPPDERVVTIEDAAELRMAQPHVVSLESRPPNMEGKGQITIRDLVRNALRMRPDRIVVGECRGGEALDMLQAMNTGHEGSMTTTHANSPREALNRLETLALMSGLDLPSRAIREQIANSVHLIVQQSRFSDGSRRVSAITEVTGVNEEGEMEYRDIFRFVRTGTDSKGKILGEFRATGYLPSFLDDFITHGLVQKGDYL